WPAINLLSSVPGKGAIKLAEQSTLAGTSFSRDAKSAHGLLWRGQKLLDLIQDALTPNETSRPVFSEISRRLTLNLLPGAGGHAQCISRFGIQFAPDIARNDIS